METAGNPDLFILVSQQQPVDLLGPNGFHQQVTTASLEAMASLFEESRIVKVLFDMGDRQHFSLWQKVRWNRLIRPVTLGSLALIVTLFSGCHSSSMVTSGRTLDFNQDVQPILASRCFSCHGPDPEMRKAGLRLDLAEWAMKKRPGHRDAIVPGHPEKSELVKRIESKDPQYLMPQTLKARPSP